MTNNQMDKINKKIYFEIRNNKGAAVKEVATYKEAVKEFENLNSNNEKYILWDNIGNRQIW